MLPLMISILQGDHVNHPAVEYVQTKKLQIENLSGEEVKVDYDGEELPEGFPGKYQYHSTGNTNRGTGKINTNLRD